MTQITILPSQVTKIKTLAGKVFPGDDAGYRDMLRVQTGRAGVASCKDLRGPEVEVVIRYLEKCAGQEGQGSGARGQGLGKTGDRRPETENRPAGRPLPPAITERQQWKIRVDLWPRVTRASKLKQGRALENFLLRMCGKKYLRWLTIAEASLVIESLKAMRQRGEREPGGADGADG